MNKILIALVLAVVMSGNVFANNNNELVFLCSQDISSKDIDKNGHPIGKPELPLKDVGTFKHDFFTIVKEPQQAIRLHSDVTGEQEEFPISASFYTYWINIYFGEGTFPKLHIDRKTLKFYYDSYTKEPAPCWVEEEEDALKKFEKISLKKANRYKQSLKF